MVLLIDSEGRLLMQRRVGTGAWHVPGGYLEPGESIEQTARREALEETGLTVGELELVGVYSGPEFHWFAPNGDEIFNVTVAFITRDFQGELRADGKEGDAVRFFRMDAFPDELGPPAGAVLGALKGRGFLG